MIDQAVILAAGKGGRLAPDIEEIHKAMVPIGGEPLLVRNCRQLWEAGICTITIVTGFMGDELSRALGEACGRSRRLRFVRSAAWQRGNGQSAYDGASTLRGDFLLLMADHLFAPEIVTSLRHVCLQDGQVCLATDRKLKSIFDMDDATKVRIDDDRIVAIGKDLEIFDAVDTGLFACSQGLTRALDQQISAGRYALSDGMQIIANGPGLLALDIGRLWWQDVDTPGALERARELIEEHVTGAVVDV